jgi:signal transduction histidine kinase
VRNARWTTLVAWTIAAAMTLLYALAAWLGFARANAHVAGMTPLTWVDVSGGVPFVAFSIVGAVIITKEPRNAVGWLLSGVGASNNLSVFLTEYADATGVLHRHLPAGSAAAWLSYWVWTVSIALAPLVLLLFPDGHFLSRRWRWVGVLAVMNIVLLAGSQMFTSFSSAPVPNPLGVAPITDFNNQFGAWYGAGSAALATVAVGSFALRYRRASGDVRHQMKWLLYVFVLLPPAFILGALTPQAAMATATPLGTVNGVVSFVANLSVPVFIGIAILKFRLYDIDVVISRTLVYGALAAFITAVYVGIVVGIGTLVGSGGKPNLALSIVATAIVAVAFQTARERLQRVANRLVYGKRATPYEVLSQFSERVAESYAADDVLPRMARVLAEGTGAERADVWLRAGNILRQAASWPANAAAAEPTRVAGDSLPGMLDADRAVEVRHQGELLGALTVTKRKGESLTPVEEKLLKDLAGQAGLVLKNVGLTAELFQRLDDLRASRQRLVAAQDEERRRLERNLHDGAQQNLVALKVKLGLAEAFADKDPARARQLLGEIKTDADEALETLRDLARGIYPPLLADKGLAAALEAQARKATLPVEVSANGIDRYPQDVEAAVYFCCLEALQNVQKYARASRATVNLAAGNGDLRFEVEDDGGGFDVAVTPRGSGLTNMADRLDALGGSSEIDSAPGRGTRLQGHVPVLVGALSR